MTSRISTDNQLLQLMREEILEKMEKEMEKQTLEKMEKSDNELGTELANLNQVI